MKRVSSNLLFYVKNETKKMLENTGTEPRGGGLRGVGVARRELRIILFSSYVEMFFSYTKSDFDCEYIALNPLIFKSVYTHHNVSSDVIVGVFWRVDFGVKRGREEL